MPSLPSSGDRSFFASSFIARSQKRKAGFLFILLRTASLVVIAAMIIGLYLFFNVYDAAFDKNLSEDMIVTPQNNARWEMDLSPISDRMTESHIQSFISTTVELIEKPSVSRLNPHNRLIVHDHPSKATGGDFSLDNVLNPSDIQNHADRKQDLAKSSQPSTKLTEERGQQRTVKPAVQSGNKDITVRPVIERSKQTIAHEKANDALKNGHELKIEAALSNANPNVQKHFKAHALLESSPEDVVPYLKSEFKQFEKSPHLLALAAQSEQRLSNHKKAIQYYALLHQLDSNDPRWMMGLAISFDAQGYSASALKWYQQALNSGQLSLALQQYAQLRLSQFEN